MTPFSKIVFPTDFSERAIAMVPCVQEWARRFAAEVTLLHAFDVAGDYILGPEVERDIPYTPALQSLRTVQEERLKEFAGKYFAEFVHHTRMEDGDAATVIDWVARHEEADLVIMPSKGVGKFRRWLLGSVTAKVLHDLTCPILTSAHAAGSAPVVGCFYRSIVCGVELDPEAGHVLGMAALLAETFGARLSIVHAEPHLGDGEPVERKLREMLPADLAPGVDVRVRLMDAGVEKGIHAAVMEENADLVVLGRGRGRENFGRIFSHLYDIIRESPCPVLSV